MYCDLNKHGKDTSMHTLDGPVSCQIPQGNTGSEATVGTAECVCVVDYEHVRACGGVFSAHVRTFANQLAWKCWGIRRRIENVPLSSNVLSVVLRCPECTEIIPQSFYHKISQHTDICNQAHQAGDQPVFVQLFSGLPRSRVESQRSWSL